MSSSLVLGLPSAYDNSVSPSTPLSRPASTCSPVARSHSCYFHVASARTDRFGCSPCKDAGEVNIGVVLALPRADSRCDCGAVLRRTERWRRLPENVNPEQKLQQSDGLRKCANRKPCRWRRQSSHLRRDHERLWSGCRHGCNIDSWHDRGLLRGGNDIFWLKLPFLWRHIVPLCERSSTVIDLFGDGASSRRQLLNRGRSHSKAQVLDCHLRYASPVRFAVGHLMFGTVLGFRSSVATAATRSTTLAGMDQNADIASPVHQDHRAVKNANVLVNSGVKIEGLEVSETMFSKSSRPATSPSSFSHGEFPTNLADRLSTNEVIQGPRGELSKGGSQSELGSKLTRLKEQAEEKTSMLWHRWKVLHDVYREDTAAWGFGTKPIFTVFEDPDGRIERVTVDENEIQRRAGIEPLLSGYADENSKALAQERIARAKSAAKDMEMGIMQPQSNSTIFTIEKRGRSIESNHRIGKFFNQIDSFAQKAAPILKTSFLVGVSFYAICILWGAYLLLSKRKQDELRKSEEAAASLMRMRKMKGQMDSGKEIKAWGTERSIQSPPDKLDFRKKLEEVREMARQVRSGEESQASFQAEAQGDTPTGLGNQLGSWALKQGLGDGSDIKVVHRDEETHVSLDMAKEKQEKANTEHSFVNGSHDEENKRDQASVLEDGSNPVVEDLRSTGVAADRKKGATNGSVQALGPDKQGNSDGGPLKPSLGVKPRIIMSPEEARAKIAGKKVRSVSGNMATNSSKSSDGSLNLQASKSNARDLDSTVTEKGTVADGTVLRSTGDSSAFDDVSERHNLNQGLNETDRFLQSGVLNGGSRQMAATQTLSTFEMASSPDQAAVSKSDKGKSGGKVDKGGEKLGSHLNEEKGDVAVNAEATEALHWMRDEVLRDVVFKVQENEKAGREPFYGLDSEKEKLFFKGLQKKFRREGESVKKWIDDRVENVDYGLSGIGLNDPPEVYQSRWKDSEKAVKSPLADKFLEDRRKLIRDKVGSQSLPSSSTSATSGKSSSNSTSSSSLSHHSTSKVSGKGVQPLDSSGNNIQGRSGTNKYASTSSKTVVTGSGQPLRKKETFQNTKQWGKELKKKYELERDPQIKSLMKEIGKDLDSWVTEEEVEEVSRLLSKEEQGEEEYVQRQYERVQAKFKEQRERFGLEAVLSKYKEYQPDAEDELWWLDLSHVLCLMVFPRAGGGGGLYSLDMTPDFEGISDQQTKKHVVAFQDRKDAMNFCYLLQFKPESEFDHAEVCPFSPKQLYQYAKEEGFKVTVLRKGQIQANVGQTVDEVEQRMFEIGSGVYWEKLERERSIDVDTILDEGFGYGHSMD